MCDTCGCDHDHDIKDKKTVDINRSLLKANEDAASNNRKHFNEKGILAINLISSPGSGKTTAIQKVLARIPRNAGGFYTREMRERGRRVGFRILTLDGQKGVMAHVDIHGPNRVGKYGVDLAVIDDLALGSLKMARSEEALIVIDEIGPMELLSQKFQDEVLEILVGGYDVLGTIAKRKNEFIR